MVSILYILTLQIYCCAGTKYNVQQLGSRGAKSKRNLKMIEQKRNQLKKKSLQQEKSQNNGLEAVSFLSPRGKKKWREYW